MRRMHSCPHCGSQFGCAMWRDNHAAACAKVKASEAARLPARVPASRPERKFYGNVRPMPRETAEALEIVLDEKKQRELHERYLADPPFACPPDAPARGGE